MISIDAVDMENVKNSSTTNHGRKELQSIVREGEMVIQVKEEEVVWKDTDHKKYR